MRQEIFRFELIVTQIQFSEINELFESLIVDSRYLIHSQNQLLHNYLWKRYDVYQVIMFEWNFRDRHIRPLTVLEMILQAPIAAVDVAI